MTSAEAKSTLATRAHEMRCLAFDVLHKAGGPSHFGGCLSEIEILTVLYGGILNIDPNNPTWEERDHFILSKGHGAVGLAAALAKVGFFGEDVLYTYKKFGSTLGWHTTKKMPGIEHPTGSLGHGLSVAVGVAFAKKLDGKASRVFTLLGDGECDEGAVWEAAMFASKYKLDNLVAIVDRNMLSMDGPTEEVMPLEPFEKKWEAFGWAAQTVDGHDIGALWNTFSGIPFEQGCPSAVIANTVKGKGVSFMENDYGWHARATTEEEYATGLKDLG